MCVNVHRCMAVHAFLYTCVAQFLPQTMPRTPIRSTKADRTELESIACARAYVSRRRARLELSAGMSPGMFDFTNNMLSDGRFPCATPPVPVTRRTPQYSRTITWNRHKAVVIILQYVVQYKRYCLSLLKNELCSSEFGKRLVHCI